MSKNWRNSRKWKETKEKVIKRDGYRCVICGQSDDLAVHHINDASYHPNQRYLIDNCVTLCRECHTNFHTNFKKSFRQKCTEYDWNNFICLTNYFKSKFTKGDQK